MKFLAVVLSGCLIVVMGGRVLAEAPATQRADQARETCRVISQSDEIVTVLDNGLTVIVRRVASPVVCVWACVNTGGVYEGRWLGGGVSHLLEHLVAGGTNARRTEEQNRNLLQEIGNNSNAYTSDDHTAYFVNTTADHFEQAVDLVTGWVLTAQIPQAEFAREHQVVQREIEMNKGQPQSVFAELVQANRYRVSPARVPIIGYQQVVAGLTRDDVYAYYKLAYVPNNMVIAVVGDLDPRTMLDTVRKHVADARPGRAFSHDIPAEPASVGPRRAVATFPGLGQAKLDLAFPSIRLDDPDLYALDLLAAILGSGESSILVEEIRDRQQLVSSIDVSSFTPSYVEGSFSISMNLESEKVEAATQALLREIEKLRAGPIDENRITRAKTLVRASRIRNMQTAEQIASSMATDMVLSGDAHFSDQYVQRIQKVTAEQLQHVARKYLEPQRLTTTVLLPAEQATAPPASQQSQHRPAGSISRVELPNGVILLHKRITTTPLVEICMFALGGLSVEDAGSNGLGNLTMSLLPRGTTTRPATQIAEFFDSIGGELDTTCGRNTWSWRAMCLRDDFGAAMEVFADIVHHPAFDRQEVAPLKQRIIAEIESQDADWAYQTLHFFCAKYFGPMNSPYQFTVLGTKANVEAFSPDQIRRWYKQTVLLSPRVLAVFGDVDLEQARSISERLLGGGASVPSPLRVASASPLPAPGPGPAIDVLRVEVQKTDQPLAGVVIGFRSDSVLGDPDSHALTVADTMTSGWGYPTGYLFDSLRGQGLVYAVQADDMPGRNADLPGTFYVHAGCEPQNVDEVIDLVLLNIARCQGGEQDMQLDWFERAKQLIVVGDAVDGQTPAQQARRAALDELVGLGFDHHSRFADRIKAVTMQDVRKIAATKLRQCVVTVSTPRPDLVRCESGLRQYSSFPPVDLTPRGVRHDSAK